MSVTITNKRLRASAKTQSGVGLIEILIALLVISVGVLGLVSMQSMGLKSNRAAYYRTQATVLAYDIIDRLRANRAQAIAGAYVVGTGPVSGTACTSGCSPAAITTTDLIQWKAELTAQLPQGDGLITPLAGGAYTVTVQWLDYEGETLPLSIGVQL